METPFFYGYSRDNMSVLFISCTSFLLICHLYAVWSPWRAEYCDKIRCNCLQCQTEFSSHAFNRHVKLMSHFQFRVLSIKFPFRGLCEKYSNILRWRYQMISFVGFHILKGGKWSHSLHYRVILRSQLQIPHTEIYKMGPLLFSHSSFWTLE